MGVDFNAEFQQLNTNKVGDSANILDADESNEVKRSGSIWTVEEGMTAEQFKEANQHCSEYDTDKDGVVTVQEQKASIADKLKNVWVSCIARFFKDDISYDDSWKSSAQWVTEQIDARIKNALEYIQYAKDNNIDIFQDNTGTGVDDDDNIQEYQNEDGTSGTVSYSSKIKSSRKNSDGSITHAYSDGYTSTRNANRLRLADSGSNANGLKWESTYDYNEDGSFVDNVTFENGYKAKIAYDKNANAIGNYYITSNGNYKAQAKNGESFYATLQRLGITNPADIKAVAKANPKAAANGYFKADGNDVYIPKSVIENMKENGTFDEKKLMGIVSSSSFGV